MRNASLGGTTRKWLLLMTDVLFEVTYSNFIMWYFQFFLFWLKLFIYENYWYFYSKLFFIDPKII